MSGHPTLDRRHFLRGALAAGALAVAPGWLPALMDPVAAASGPYGSLSAGPDANGLLLAPGFTSRVVAVSGAPVRPGGYVWHTAPDGGATFAERDGGWIYASNCELPAPHGGAGAIRFAPDGTITDAYRILDGTSRNCAGGRTPWGTWLSCEEHDTGHVWECNVRRPGQGVERPLLGTFAHEAAAVDPVGQAVYLTEDRTDSRLYRFRPWNYPDLSGGRLQAAMVDAAGRVTWKRVSTTKPDRSPETKVFNRGEGAWYHAGRVYFTTTGTNRVWALDTERQRLSLVYNGKKLTSPVLTNVDNVTVHRRSGDLFVAEDGGDLDICTLTKTATGRYAVAPFVRVAGPTGSEVTGVAFSPRGDRLYFSSQRGTLGSTAGPGITFEVTGPFRGLR
jgi:secreted PhoX family phosphatase